MELKRKTSANNPMMEEIRKRRAEMNGGNEEYGQFADSEGPKTSNEGDNVRNTKVDNSVVESSEEDKEKYVNSKCPNCGNELRFVPGTNKLKCDACDSTFTIESLGRGKLDEEETDVQSTIEKLKKEEKVETVRLMRCQDCGGLITLGRNQLSLKCPYCDSNRVIKEEKQETIVPINGVIPFAFSEDRVKEKFQAWMKTKKMAPVTFKKGVKSPTFSSFYIPFYTFDSQTFTKFKGMRGDYYYVTVGSGKSKHRERRTKWTPVSGKFARVFDDLLISGSNNILNNYVYEAANFDFNQMEKYQEQYLLGYYSERPSIGLEDGFKQGRAEMINQIKEECIRRIGGDTYSDLDFDTKFSNVTYKLIMAPIYNGTYMYGKKKYNFVLNGQTGKGSGKAPLSVLKVSLIVLAALLVITGIFILAYIESNS